MTVRSILSRHKETGTVLSELQPNNHQTVLFCSLLVKKRRKTVSESLESLQPINTRQFLLGTVRSLLPSLIFSIACMLIVYNLLRPHFPPSSVLPLLVASLCPLLANVVSLVRQRQLDVFGIM